MGLLLEFSTQSIDTTLIVRNGDFCGALYIQGKTTSVSP